MKNIDSKRGCRTGIFGGTFDPPHIGHLIVTEDVRMRFDLDRIVFVPSARPPHKIQSPMTESVHRYRMTELAIRGNPHFEVSDCEIQRPGASYTVDTVKHFRRVYGRDCELFFIMGGDSIFEIDTWKNPEEIVNDCTVIVTSRPGFDLSGINDRFKEKVISTDVTRIGISSTMIRERIRDGGSIAGLVPEAVETYIRKEGLYV